MESISDIKIDLINLITKYAEIDAYSQGKIRKESINFSSITVQAIAY